MSIDIERTDLTTNAHVWDRAVERSSARNPLFLAEALRYQALESDTNGVALLGRKGQEVVGLFPVFVYEKGPVTGVFSPPPRSWSPYLGPAMIQDPSAKRRTIDSRTERFIEGCLDWITDRFAPMYTTFTTAAVTDLRSFDWNGYDIDPEYTYVVDLNGSPESLLERFSADARRNVSDVPDRIEIDRGDGDDVEWIVRQVAARYDEQDRPFGLDPTYVRRLYERLPDGAIVPYVGRVDDEPKGGILVLEWTDTRLRWLGGFKVDDVDVPVNDILDWQIMCDGIDRGMDRYDMVGAGVPSINRYKAKFNPRLETHYTVSRGRFGVDVLVDTYRKYA